MIIFLSENPIAWKTNKQRSISTSTMEAEYIALEVTVKEIIWINTLFEELTQKTSLTVPCKPYIIRYDNKSVIDFTKNKIAYKAY